MTLTARPKRTASHKKASGQHHRKTRVYHKAYWPYLPILAILFAGFVSNAIWPARHGVLAYATDMSIQTLLSNTNSQRSSSGLGSLTLNTQLDQAAQSKANDMAARDYWSHNTPDGQTPWTFMTAAGYNYQTAGENLAYGFTSANDTITGWMNSPGHRDNILNSSYQEVGFGVANATNYQGSGPETIVVAMYAKPVGSAVATQPDSSTNSVTSQTLPAPTSTSTNVVAEQATTPSEATTPTEPVVASDTSLPKQAVVTTAVKPVVESNSRQVSNVQLLTAGKAPWSITAVTVVTAIGIMLFFARHGIAWHKVLRKGERFFIKHPTLDIVVTTVVVVGLLLSRTAGSIR